MFYVRHFAGLYFILNFSYPPAIQLLLFLQFAAAIKRNYTYNP